jgi:putative DNA-invertase from lambdoid prophage Rac
MRAAIYVRVSTADQNCELQIRDLHDYAARLGWDMVESYEDVSSGAKSSRPGLNRMMADATARKFGSCPKSVIAVEGLSIQWVPVRRVLRSTPIRHPTGAWLG